MPDRISKVLGVPNSALRKQGVFDGFYRFDSLFHIDPALLRATTAPELRYSHQTFERYFADVLRLLTRARAQTSALWNEAIRRLMVPEINIAALGYSADGAEGHAIGFGLANNLATTAHEIIEAGISDPVIFELVGLIQEGIGADLISDMTLTAILPDVVNFNHRVIEKLNLNSTEVTLLNTRVTVPATADNNPILLLPEDILSPLPIAQCWSDIDVVARYNDNLRYAVNRLIGNTWKQATNRSRVTKRELREALLHHPELLRDLIEQYRGKPVTPYDFDSDPLGELLWQEVADAYVDKFPLALVNPTAPNEVVTVVSTICGHFRELVEANGLSELLYDNQGNLRPERTAQLSFFGIADSYCRANNLDISPECNSGRGSVDFKFSRGYGLRLNVEVKYSSNTKLVSGYTKQLPTYDAAEKSFHSIYLVLRTTDSESSIRRLQKLRNDALLEGKRAPDIFVIDARSKPAASHR